MIPALIKLFNVVAVAPEQPLLDPVEVNAYAMRCGYMVLPGACTPDVIVFLKDQQVNFNSTFYKNWAQVDRLSELQMHLLQLVHYMSTYGTGYTGPTFTLNDIPEEMQFSNFKMLTPCTDRELFDRIAAMLESGIALDTPTLDLLIEQLAAYHDQYQWRIDIDRVANREALVRLCDLYGATPSQPERIVRLIVYKACQTSLIIKNVKTWKSLSASVAKVAPMIASLDDSRICALASVFYRYKPIFLALRRGAVKFLKRFDNAMPWEREFPTAEDKALAGHMRRVVVNINRIRRLAPRYHRPMPTGVLESILDPRHSMDAITGALARENSVFKLIRIYNYVADCIACDGVRTFFIRNGKIFVRRWQRSTYYPSPLYGRLQPIYDAVRSRLLAVVARGAVKDDGSAHTVLFPTALSIAAPVSERQFVGALPYGSSYPLQEHNYIGIYWRNEWGTNDFDLWMVDSSGESLGWASAHKATDVMFSGDMTNADPEATEIFYGKGSWPDCTIKVNRYNGREGSKFRLFFGSEEIRDLTEGYMVNPDSIHFSEDLISDCREKMIGIISGGKAFFTSVETGNGLVPDLGADTSFITAVARRFNSYLPLRRLLLDAGYAEFIPDPAMPDARPDIDLTNLDKDTLISIFAQ